MRRARRDEVAAWREATNETTSFRMWKHAVVLAAVRKGATSYEDLPTEAKERVGRILHRAYDAGEPVWMATDEVAFVSKELTKKRRLEPREELRQAVAAYYTRPRGDASRRSRKRRVRTRRTR